MRAARSLAGHIGARLVVLAGAALWLAPAAWAAPGWTRPVPVRLPPGAQAAGVQVGYADGGVATAAFRQTVGRGRRAATILRVGTIAPGDAYRDELRIPRSGGASPGLLSLSVAGDGAAVLLYDLVPARPSGTTRTLAAYRPPGTRRWQPPIVLARDAGRVAAPAPVTMIAPDGTAAALVAHGRPGRSAVTAALHGPAGAWAPTADLHAVGGAPAGSIAAGFDGAGVLTVALRRRDGLAVRTWTGGTWSPVTPIPRSRGAAPLLAVGSDGSATLAYADPTGAAVRAVTRAAGGASWSGPVLVRAHSRPLAIAPAPTGGAVLLLATSSCVVATELVPGARPLGTRCLSPAGTSAGAAAAAGAADGVLLAWTTRARRSALTRLQATRWAAGATAPLASRTLAATRWPLLLRAALPDAADLAVDWALPGRGGGLWGAAFDISGPVLLASDVPAAPPALSTAAYSATFADPWAGIGRLPVWRFGDGTAPVSGAQVSHAYAQAGTYTVTVRATDRLGNPTTATFPVTVLPPLPRLSGVSETAQSWTPSSGTTFAFNLNEAAQVSLAFSATGFGANRPVGTLSVAGVPGANSVPFNGTLNGSQLPAGDYAVAITATVGAESSSTKTLHFTILPGQ